MQYSFGLLSIKQEEEGKYLNYLREISNRNENLTEKMMKINRINRQRRTTTNSYRNLVKRDYYHLIIMMILQIRNLIIILITNSYKLNYYFNFK